MCRLCIIYDRIEISTLPKSNPWMDLEDEPELPVPNTITVQSPESSRYTAWNNTRFPALQRLSIDSDMSSSSSDSRRATMLPKIDSYRGVDSSTPARWASPVATYSPVTQRKAVPGDWPRDRVNRRNSSSVGSTPEATTPVLEDITSMNGGVQYRAYAPPAEYRSQYYRPYSRYRQSHNGSMNSAMNQPVPESPSDYINNLTSKW